jgi:hypothetical protein
MGIRSLLATAILLFALTGGAALHFSAPRDTASDKETLLRLESEWLYARDAPTLDRILAADFVHIAPGGYFLTKAEHVDWFLRHPPPANRNVRFDRMKVRFYGDTGIVNGLVITADDQGRETQRTAFTDVFVFRQGRWQAVNAQEDPVTMPTR